MCVLRIYLGQVFTEQDLLELIRTSFYSFLHDLNSK